MWWGINIVDWILVLFYRTSYIYSIAIRWFIGLFLKYSQPCPRDHLWTETTPDQRPLFYFPSVTFLLFLHPEEKPLSTKDRLCHFPWAVSWDNFYCIYMYFCLFVNDINHESSTCDVYIQLYPKNMMIQCIFPLFTLNAFIVGIFLPNCMLCLMCVLSAELIDVLYVSGFMMTLTSPYG